MEDFNRKETFAELLIQDCNKRLKGNIDKDDEYNVAILASLPEEILKLYVLFSTMDSAEIHRSYILGKIARIINNVPINMPPGPARNYVSLRDEMIKANT